MWELLSCPFSEKKKNWKNLTVQRDEGLPCWPLFGLCLSRYSSSFSYPPLITTQVRVRSTRGAFFAAFRGKFWTPSLSSQGSEGHNGHALLLTLKKVHRQVNILSMKQSEREWHKHAITTVFNVSDTRRLPAKLPQQLPGVLLLFQMNLHRSVSKLD